ncbi:MAG: caspase family protein [Saprospiraceae bacterium]|nr:caspase family protein [Lewinella sp.]
MSNTFENGYALLIGVSEQKDSRIPSLGSVRNDIERFRDLLINPAYCAYKPENVLVLTGKDATKANIKSGLDKLEKLIKANTSGDATGIIYYSGHGFQEKEGTELLLIPHDAILDAAELEDSAIKDSYLQKKIENSIKPKRLMLLLDCCQAGAIGSQPVDLSEVEAIADVQAASPKIFVSEDNTEPLGKDIREEMAKVIPPPGEETNQQTGSKPIPGTEKRYSTPPQIGDGRAVLASSQDQEKSWILPDPPVSIFTYHLIEAFTGYAPHLPDATEVNILSVMDYVSVAVPKSAQKLNNEPQHPTFRMHGDNFPVAKLMGGKGLAPGAPLPRPEGMEPVPSSVINTWKNNNSSVVGNFNITNQDITDSEIHITQTDNRSEGNNAGGDQGTAANGTAELKELFETVSAEIEKMKNDPATEDSTVLVEHHTKKAEQELLETPPEEMDKSRIEKWLDSLKENAPNILEKVADIVANPKEGVAIGIRTIADLVRKVKAN